MQVNIVKKSAWRIPRCFLEAWMDGVSKELAKRTSHKVGSQSITFAFVEASEMKSLNRQFRKKNKVTDILSFEGFEKGDLGDLVLCGEVIESQAKAHDLQPRQELGYLAIHGLLHLLGYEHEQGGTAEKKMFRLQDELFEVLWPKFFKKPF